GVSLALLAMTGLLFVHVPKGFIPNEDQGFVFTVVETAEGVSFEQMTRLQLAVTDIVRADPSVEEQFSSSSPSSASTASTLYQAAPRLEARLRALRELQDVTSDLQIKSPQVNVVIDRDKASTLGVSAEQIEDALFDAYGNRWVSTIYAPTNQYKVIMEVEPQYQRDAAALSRLYVRSASGQLVPLAAVARLAETVGPLTVNHFGQLPAVTISFNLAPGHALGDAVEAVGRVAHETLPATI